MSPRMLYSMKASTTRLTCFSEMRGLFTHSRAIALAMLDEPIASLEGLAALMAYAGEYVRQGLLWPEGIIDDTIDEKPRDWIELVLIKAATTVRQLCPVAS
jgi:hypothetical protein